MEEEECGVQQRGTHSAVKCFFPLTDLIKGTRDQLA